MERHEEKMTAREKRITLVCTCAFALLGAVLGAIAYYRQWLG